MDKIIAFLHKVGHKKLTIFSGAFFLTLGVLVYLLMFFTRPEMGILFSDLDVSDGGKIIERLNTMNVPFEISDDGSKIMAPKDTLARIRMDLAQEGIPNGGNIGFEIFEKTDTLGLTNALLDINYARALEGELARSIKTIQGIAFARVHLVLPKRELFSRDKQMPSASVMIKLKKKLSYDQIQAIQHLIAASVPEMTAERVSVIDNKGILLAKGSDQHVKVSENFYHQQEMRVQIESKLAGSIESILAKVIGNNKYRVEVSAELDFDQLSSSATIYDPDGQVLKHRDSTEEGEHDSALQKNIGMENHILKSNKLNNSDNPRQYTLNSSEKLDYEISKIKKNFIKEVGAIKHLSVSVVLDALYKRKKNGTIEAISRSYAEIEKISQLVKNAIGFKEERGDSISVIDLPFFEQEYEEPTFTNNFLWKKEYIVYAFLAFFSLIILFVMTKIVIVRSSKKDLETHTIDENSLEKVQDFVEHHPEKAVSIFRRWMHPSPTLQKKG